MGLIDMTPFLFSYSKEREAAEPIPGQYCKKINMWAVGDKDGERALIDAFSSIAELTTKTEQETEADDQSKQSLLEIETKTFTVTEQDDEKKVSALLEVSTKTKVELESDDTAPRSRGLFL